MQRNKITIINSNEQGLFDGIGGHSSELCTRKKYDHGNPDCVDLATITADVILQDTIHRFAIDPDQVIKTISPTLTFLQQFFLMT